MRGIARVRSLGDAESGRRLVHVLQQTTSESSRSGLVYLHATRALLPHARDNIVGAFLATQVEAASTAKEDAIRWRARKLAARALALGGGTERQRRLVELAAGDGTVGSLARYGLSGTSDDAASACLVGPNGRDAASATDARWVALLTAPRALGTDRLGGWLAQRNLPASEVWARHGATSRDAFDDVFRSAASDDEKAHLVRGLGKSTARWATHALEAIAFSGEGAPIVQAAVSEISARMDDDARARAFWFRRYEPWTLCTLRADAGTP